MWWLILALAAQALLAIVALGDKFLLTSSIGRPATYAAAVGLAGFLVVLAAPFMGWPWFGWQISYLAFASGILFILALLPFYEGIRRFETSRIVPATGALIPVFTLLFSWLLFSNVSGVFGGRSILAFMFLILGGVWISREPGKKISGGTLKFGLAAAPIFSLSTVVMKAAYLRQTFWSGFFWGTLGLAFAGLAIFVLDKRVREDLRSAFKKTDRANGSSSTKIYFLLVQVCGSVATVLQSGANYLVPPPRIAFLNALQGTQYVFLFILSSLVGFWYPGSKLRENMSAKIVMNKIFAIGVILGGIILLVMDGYN